MTKPDKKQTFFIFVLEAYKNKAGISGIKAYEDFKAKKVFSFLSDGYEVLHTQSTDFVVDEVIRYIKNKK